MSLSVAGTAAVRGGEAGRGTRAAAAAAGAAGGRLRRRLRGRREGDMVAREEIVFTEKFILKIRGRKECTILVWR
jgi:hypothetical protein